MKTNKFKYLWKTDGTAEWHYVDFANDNLRAKFEAWESVKANSPLLQFTGLKDKTGNEIYEGDILHITTEDLVNMNYETVVEWTDSGFYKDFMNYDKAEIIGNIYQKGEKK